MRGLTLRFGDGASAETILEQAGYLLEDYDGGIAILDLDGELFVQAADCPHLRGPLEDALHKTGEIKCPWHGYRFNVDSGECVSPVEANCKLPTAPTIDYRENGTVSLIRSAT